MRGFWSVGDVIYHLSIIWSYLIISDHIFGKSPIPIIPHKYHHNLQNNNVISLSRFKEVVALDHPPQSDHHGNRLEKTMESAISGSSW